MSQPWRTVGNTVSDLTGLRFEPQTSRSRDERVTALSLFLVLQITELSYSFKNEARSEFIGRTYKSNVLRLYQNLKKSGFAHKIPWRDCNAVYIGETERSLKTRKREHFEAFKTMDMKKSALEPTHPRFWSTKARNEAEIKKKIEPITVNVVQRRLFFINQRATEVNVLTEIDSASVPVVHGMLMD